MNEISHLVSSVHVPGRMEKRIQGKFHPRSPFMNGLVMVMGNPGVLLFWIVLSVNFMSRGLVEPNMAGKGACVLGVALGDQRVVHQPRLRAASLGEAQKIQRQNTAAHGARLWNQFAGAGTGAGLLHRLEDCKT